MFRHSLFFFLILILAVGVPYFGSQWGNIGQMLTSGGTPAADPAAAPPADVPPASPTAAANLGIGPALGGVVPGNPAADLPPVVDLSEALRFDVTAAWVLGHWPRVTTGLPDEDLQGYRVPLVTGTQDDDLAGSLTYYFNKQQRCQRITFQGTTGDARKLVNLLTQRYGFVKQTSNDPGLYLYQIRWNGRATSELHIRPSRVVRASTPLARFEILLAMNDAGAK